MAFFRPTAITLQTFLFQTFVFGSGIICASCASISKKSETSWEANNSQTVFQSAQVLAKKGDTKQLLQLIELHPQLIHESVEPAETLLATAVVFKNEDTVKGLLKLGSDPDLRDQHQISILQKGLQDSSVGVALALVRASRAVDSVDSDGWSALFFAVNRQSDELVRSLLQKGADAKKISRNGESVCDLLIDKNWKAGFQLLPHCHPKPKETSR